MVNHGAIWPERCWALPFETTWLCWLARTLLSILPMSQLSRPSPSPYHHVRLLESRRYCAHIFILELLHLFHSLGFNKRFGSSVPAVWDTFVCFFLLLFLALLRVYMLIYWMQPVLRFTLISLWLQACVGCSTAQGATMPSTFVDSGLHSLAPISVLLKRPNYNSALDCIVYTPGVPPPPVFFFWEPSSMVPSSHSLLLVTWIAKP
jgi:hypothetical protein